MDRDARRAIDEICQDAVDRLSRVAGDAHGVQVAMWCSSNDPGWKFSVEEP